MKKYFKKRTQIQKIIEGYKFQFQDPHDETGIGQIDFYPNWDEAQELAEKILSKIGINKPQS